MIPVIYKKVYGDHLDTVQKLAEVKLTDESSIQVRRLTSSKDKMETRSISVRTYDHIGHLESGAEDAPRLDGLVMKPAVFESLLTESLMALDYDSLDRVLTNLVRKYNSQNPDGAMTFMVVYHLVKQLGPVGFQKFARKFKLYGGPEVNVPEVRDGDTPDRLAELEEWPATQVELREYLDESLQDLAIETNELKKAEEPTEDSREEAFEDWEARMDKLKRAVESGFAG